MADSRKIHLNEAKVNQVMKQVGIPGISLAFFDQNGPSDTKTIGVDPSSMCDLILIDKIPNQNNLDQFPIKSNAAYVRTGDKLFYINKVNKKITEIPLDKESLKIFDVELQPNRTAKTLAEDQLNKITSITNNPVHTVTKLTSDSIFRAASLTKPVFAYLVLKLIEDNKSKTAKPGLGEFILPDNLKAKGFTLDTPFYEIFSEDEKKIFLSKFSKEDSAKAEKLTARLILSHQSGLPIKPGDEPLKFQFDPGTNYAYSNPGIALLQEVVEKLTGSNLQSLGKANVFDPLNMTNSNFYRFNRVLMSTEEPKLENMRPDTIFMLKEGEQLTAYWLDNGAIHKQAFHENAVQEIVKMLPKVGKILNDAGLIKAITSTYGCKLAEIDAANSLHTTASDYARFVTGLLSNENLREQMFHKEASLINDQWARGQGLKDDDLKKIGWGLGWGLELNESDKATKAFHSGDMNEWRAFVAIDINKKQGIVYFSNSKDGLILADEIIKPENIELNTGLKYIFDKYGFARNIEAGWQDKEVDRVCKIIVKNELDLADLQEKKLINIDSDATLHTLTITGDSDYPYIINRAISKEFDDFAEKNQMKNTEYLVNTTQDGNGNNSVLKINIFNDKLYNQFIDHLKTENLLPTQKVIQQDIGSSIHKSPSPSPYKQ